MKPVLMMTAAVLLACVAYSHQVEMAEFEDAALSDGQLVREAREAVQQNQEFVRRKRQEERHIINQDAHPRYPHDPMQNFDEIDLFPQADWPETV